MTFWAIILMVVGAAFLIFLACGVAIFFFALLWCIYDSIKNLFSCKKNRKTR